MLNLGVSLQSCLPGLRSSDGGAKRPADCMACGAPGGDRGELLEEHRVGKEKKIFLCPMCHMCLHLDHAGRTKAGRVIWLPEMSQEKLNVLSLAMFVAISKSGAYRSNDDVKGVVQASKRLFEAFERRAESVEVFLGGSAIKTLMPRQALSSPVHVASLLVRIQREAKLKPSELAARIDGLRLLPSPAAYEKYIDMAARHVAKRYPIPTWASLAAEAAAAHQATLASEPATHFDAEPVIA
ncbi:hypothetical protein ABIC83_002651 [Roseateles asaccharophilus]|uniref:hypothetical protein n=1 Tax=Roseateles asaccharophilus TaxID=582607 RepID=UPI0038357A4D